MECTVISMLPYPLPFDKTSVQPQLPGLPAVEKGDFVIQHVKDGVRPIYISDGKSVNTPVPGEHIAASIVNDHIRSMMAVNETAYPAIRMIEGHHTKDEIEDDFADLLKGMTETQNNWFQRLVRIADDSWSNPMNPGKHRSISDLQRTAAKRLGLNREWLTSVPIDQVRCPACRIFIPGDATICYNCKTPIGK